ncbi:MAG: TfoX/Sxy family protein [Planctomycetaceae bacterium]|nr:TfoX/Sxy family protein [Planctomycetaceae bacterium]
MPYDEQLADRIRGVLKGKRNITEKKMFGGICFFLKGNILCGIHKKNLILRLGPDEAEIALLRPHFGPFDITGRPMKGWVMAKPAGFKSDEKLKAEIELAMQFVKGLPAKD